jgi:hypothetical protein
VGCQGQHGGGRIVALWVYHENSSFLPTSTNKKVLIVIKYLAVLISFNHNLAKE